MKSICTLLKFFLLGAALVGSLSYGVGFDQSSLKGFRYGPNMSWGVSGNTPLVWGQWVPQVNAGMHFTWLEPIDPLNYGASLGKIPTYLKMEGSVELAPFYGGYRAGLGLRPFKTNPQLEFNFVYESYFYFKTNLEMVSSDVAGEGRIAETWNADYILDHVGESDSSDFDYAQLFDMSIDLTYNMDHGGVIGVSAHYIRSDISTDFNGKSYDYGRNIPVFSRDYIVELIAYGRVEFSKHVAGIFESSYLRTGLLRSGSNVKKEALSYRQVMLGPHFTWSNGSRSLTFEVGMWNRDKKRFYNGSLAQQFLVQLEYQGYFSFPFHGDFSE